MSAVRRSLAGLLQRGCLLSTLQQKPLALLALSASDLLQHTATSSSVRTIFSSPTPKLSVALADALKREVDHEATEYEQSEIVENGPPAPFTLQEAPGDTLLTLTRDFNGEKVSIDLQVNNQPAAEDFVEGEGEEAQAINSVAFNVAVVRGSHQLVFDCESDGNDIIIQHVSHERVGTVNKDTDFTGPVFSELDEALIREFKSYLTERGIDADLGEYLRHLVHDKEQREYRAWLQRSHDFIAKK